MVVERYPAEDPREWLNRARSNLARARVVEPEFYLEDRCFDAQQAAEKAMKGVLLALGVIFPYTHDLTRLGDLIRASGEEVTQPLIDAADLTVYAVTTRYPDLGEPVTPQEHRRAVEIAEAVARWAEDRVATMRPPPA